MHPKDYAQLLYETAKGKTAAQQGKILERFEALLIKNKDTHIAGAVEKEFQKIHNQKGKEKITYISTASGLSTIQEKELESITSAPREFSVNPNLLGGIAVRQGDTIHNATLRKKMESLKSLL